MDSIFLLFRLSFFPRLAHCLHVGNGMNVYRTIVSVPIRSVRKSFIERICGRMKSALFVFHYLVKGVYTLKSIKIHRIYWIMWNIKHKWKSVTTMTMTTYTRTHTRISFFWKRGERGGLRRHPSLMECASKLTISLDWKACYTIPSYINVWTNTYSMEIIKCERWTDNR